MTSALNSIANHTLSIGANSLAYLKSGSGSAVIIVYSIGGHKEDWREIMQALAVQHTAYAIDMIGIGAGSSVRHEISKETRHVRND